ncbi:hypothetical protein Cgig2_021375 [Carnegiea gigantea]|uniref:Uncharacterized protein n=1 Tax=Carnegiea gigantea TaxID=171969 RepID=A0A9Q1KBH4_9CARY|nr:hypothetical protein Cgig2_021375 [Carnegiea gigantea]
MLLQDEEGEESKDIATIEARSNKETSNNAPRGSRFSALLLLGPNVNFEEDQEGECLPRETIWDDENGNGKENPIVQPSPNLQAAQPQEPPDPAPSLSPSLQGLSNAMLLGSSLVNKTDEDVFQDVLSEEDNDERDRRMQEDHANMQIREDNHGLLDSVPMNICDDRDLEWRLKSVDAFAIIVNRPWLLARDFNENRTLEERDHGGTDMARWCLKFNNWIENNTLLDLGFSRPKFICSRWFSQKMRKSAWLDRAFCNKIWGTSFKKVLSNT